MATIDSSIQYLKGVGPAFAKKFERLGIATIRDLLLCYPRKYIDYTQPYTVASAPYDVDCCIKATVLQKEPARRIKGGRVLNRVLAADDSGVVTLSWFNAAYAAEKLMTGETYYFEGRVGGTLTHRELLHPLVRTEAQVAASPFVPVYHGTEGLPASRQANCARAALTYVEELQDPLPPELLTRYKMPTKAQAVRAVHAPKDHGDLAAARRRLIFEELYLLQIGIFLLRSHGRRQTSAPMRPMRLDPFWGSLPYAPTGAQRRATEEITRDLCGDVPMNRLLQGDVGSGKTLVAAAAIWFAAQNGWQSAMLAPTEILARQHFLSLQPLLQPLSVRCALLTGSTKAAERKQLLQELKNGDIHLLIGTHALLTGDVVFQKLGLVVTDEQHRFGVAQRAALAQKGDHPHLLVMSATPIPRTLALMIYGDLDLSLLDELPPGRQPIDTFLIDSPKRERAFAFIRRHLDAGRQAYLICPLVEDNDSDMQSVTHYCEELKAGPFRNYTIWMLHGRMKPAEKDRVMADFSAGHTQILVSTTVVEVGVDVPNATIMLIENAERYGLSQLHQLRGRVGRGREKSTCILVSDAQNDQALRRLHVFTSTQSGFVIADEDLRLRGPGDFFGHKQHGLPALRIAQLGEDTDLLRLAQQEAGRLVREDADLSMPEHRTLRAQVRQLFARQETAMA